MTLLPGVARWPRPVAALAVAMVAVASYFGSLRHGFIYDDYWTIVGNEHLDRPLRALMAQALSGRNVELGMPDATRPALSVSLWLDRKLFGLQPAGYHLHSLVLYAAACVAAYLLAGRLFRDRFRALVAGLAYAGLPLHAEVVAAVNYREDLQVALGLFGALALSLGPLPDAWRKWRGPGVAALWLYALFAKENALVGPLLLAALCVVRRPARDGATGRAPWWLWSVAVGLFWLSWRHGVSVLGEQVPRAESVSFTAVSLGTARYAMHALWRSLVPLTTTVEYPSLDPASALWLLPLGVLVGALAWAWRRPGARWPIAFVLFALAASAVTSPLVGPVNERADRYFFVGSFAAALAFAWFLDGVRRRSSPLAHAGLLAAVLALVPLSHVAARAWDSEASLWTSAVTGAPHSARAWSQLSRVHRIAGQHELAEWAVQKSLEERPDYVPARVAATFNSLWAGDLVEARRRLREVAPRTELHSAGMRAAAYCARKPTAEEARRCAHQTVPHGLVVGDENALRAFSERRRSVEIAPR